MRKLIIVIFSCLSAFFATANDGVFYASGNQLIPITETDISVKKEILTLNRVGDHLEVTVYYEFFNPVGEKELLVGFEAQSPYNSMADALKMLPKHPHIRNFKVVVNGDPLIYEIAHVDRGCCYMDDTYTFSQYYVNGKFTDWTAQRIRDTLAACPHPPGMPIDYVYHFKAKFRHGLNIIQHTYDYDLSFSQEYEFYFFYVLTAANRWANHQIDDFTLNINMGDRESFMIRPDFFKTADEWVFTGRGKTSVDSIWSWYEDLNRMTCPNFHIQEGGLSFHKANFHPEGDLHIYKRNYWSYFWSYREEDYGTLSNGLMTALSKEGYFVRRFSGFSQKSAEDTMQYTRFQRRILKNLPFAYRGHIFRSKKKQDYFESTEWYLPNPDYKANMETLSSEEKKWVEFWK
ncbi:MAG: YARHG domain-containing protein [Bacteroidales bacterium]|nr:YARHG domain-containing protein [Bacteroidales bacterium]